MKKLTAEEIIQLVKDADISVSDFAHGYFSEIDLFTFSEEIKQHWEVYNSLENYEKQKSYVRDKLGGKSIRQLMEEEYLGSGIPPDPILGEWKTVKQHGGMDQGSDWYAVKYFKDHDVYIRTDGWYQSHHGTEFENGYGSEVFPKQKTITVYE